jgi:hypothetical protein
MYLHNIFFYPGHHPIRQYCMDPHLHRKSHWQENKYFLTTRNCFILLHRLSIKTKLLQIYFANALTRYTKSIVTLISTAHTRTSDAQLIQRMGKIIDSSYLSKLSNLHRMSTWSLLGVLR